MAGYVPVAKPLDKYFAEEAKKFALTQPPKQSSNLGFERFFLNRRQASSAVSC